MITALALIVSIPFLVLTIAGIGYVYHEDMQL